MVTTFSAVTRTAAMPDLADSIKPPRLTLREADWRSLRAFNAYRLALVAVLLGSIFFQADWIARLNWIPGRAELGWLLAYAAVCASGWGIARHWPRRFNTQLSFQVAIDVLAISAAMYFAGGVGSGLGLVLLVSLAAASVVGQGRLVLFYAAMATLAALLSQLYGILQQRFDQASIVQAGFISAGYFATAILAWLLGQRVRQNEELARRRGEALENQIRINQRVVERMQEGILIVSPGGVLLRHNPQAASLMALPEEGSSLGALAPGLINALVAAQTGAAGREVILEGREQRELSARFERTESSDGEWLVFVEDRARLQARARELKLASLGRLTASIAHEIRNPLAAISHAGELLHEETADPTHARLLRIIHDNTGRLNRIVSDVLALGRQKHAQPEEIELAPFCEQVARALEASEHLAPGQIFVQVMPDAALCFDRAQLHQIIWNLVVNAARYASSSPGAIRLEVAPGATPEWIELHVADDGPGVAEAVREQIFEPFFTTDHRGTGLGLFIARELAAANGAQLVLHPLAGHGHFVLSGRRRCCHPLEPSDVLAVS